MLNLINNAIEAMGGNGDGGELAIRTASEDGNRVLVTVADLGPGFAPAAFAKTFEPFYTTKPDGLGLGLSICRSIIEAHGGQLSARANTPRGAVFEFSVPAKSPSSECSGARRAPVDPSRLRPTSRIENGPLWPRRQWIRDSALAASARRPS